MLCTFCGTDNRSENKFCGMCGVRLERRKVERRTRHSSASLKCPSCENMVEPGSIFCGMCGGRVERRITERRVNDDRATAIANTQLPPPEVPETEAEDFFASDVLKNTAVLRETSRVPDPTIAEISPHHPQPAIFRSAPRERTSTISGPSFLGLNDPPPAGSTDYLLEEERSSGRMVSKLVIMAVVVAALGLIFVQWRSSLSASPKEPVPPKIDPGADLRQLEQKKAETAAAAQSSGTSETKTDESASTNTEANAASESKGAKDNKTAPVTSEPAEPASASPGKNAGAATSTTAVASKAAATNSAANIPDDSSNGTSKKTKPAAAGPPTLAKPSATLLKAQDYLQGRAGVKQDCEQGLVYLRAAAQKNEPAAAMQMGELYATGQCVQQDRVTAYRWMNSARELAPGNQVIQTSVDQLWGRMTPQERRDAGH